MASASATERCRTTVRPTSPNRFSRWMSRPSRAAAAAFQDRGGNAEHRLLGRIRIGDEAAVDHVGRPRDLGERAGDQPAGAGFRGRHREPAGAAALQHA
jgi:hypothetical protein